MAKQSTKLANLYMKKISKRAMITSRCKWKQSINKMNKRKMPYLPSLRESSSMERVSHLSV